MTYLQNDYFKEFNSQLTFLFELVKEEQESVKQQKSENMQTRIKEILKNNFDTDDTKLKKTNMSMELTNEQVIS